VWLAAATPGTRQRAVWLARRSARVVLRAASQALAQVQKAGCCHHLRHRLACSRCSTVRYTTSCTQPGVGHPVRSQREVHTCYTALTPRRSEQHHMHRHKSTRPMQCACVVVGEASNACVRSLAYMSSSSLACKGWGSLQVLSARVLLLFYMSGCCVCVAPTITSSIQQLSQ
jgi:hypothetical protein